jgi:Domain of unknown function (DUF4214)/RTX calcium-binding nonapeptide repeat (4 copies)
MASIEIAGRRVGQDVSTGAGHLALILTDDLGAEFILSAYTDNTLFSGELFIETYGQSAWVPRGLSSENSIAEHRIDRVTLDLGARSPAAVAMLIDQFALAMNGQTLSYEVFDQNSNSVIGTLLDLVGIDVDDVLPNPSGVGWLGFVARDTLIQFPYSIVGTPEADIIQTRGFDQEIFGAGGDDRLSGGAGDDRLSGGAGDDLLDGGQGIDTAVVSGTKGSYTLSIGPENVVLLDRRPGGEGADTLIQIEHLQFSGAPADAGVYLSGLMALPKIAEADLRLIIELYVAYFDRAPDAEGLHFWAGAFAGGVSLDQMSQAFSDQAETIATYPAGTSAADFAFAVYDNVLGRAPDPDGLNFWLGLLNSGQVQRDEFILRVLEGAKAEPPEDLGQDFMDQQLADVAFLRTKTDIGAYFAVQLGMSDVQSAASAMAQFDGSDDGLAAAIATIDQAHFAALDPVDGAFLVPVTGILDDLFAVA